MTDPKPTPLLCDSLDFEGRQRVMHLEEYEPEALAWHAAVLERKLTLAVEALDAMIVYTIQGQPGYRTHNGIAQAMPRKTERVVRKALAQIKGEAGVTAATETALWSRDIHEQ